MQRCEVCSYYILNGKISSDNKTLVCFKWNAGISVSGVQCKIFLKFLNVRKHMYYTKNDFTP